MTKVKDEIELDLESSLFAGPDYDYCAIKKHRAALALFFCTHVKTHIHHVMPDVCKRSGALTKQYAWLGEWSSDKLCQILCREMDKMEPVLRPYVCQSMEDLPSSSSTPMLIKKRSACAYSRASAKKRRLSDCSLPRTAIEVDNSYLKLCLAAESRVAENAPALSQEKQHVKKEAEPSQVDSYESNKQYSPSPANVDQVKTSSAPRAYSRAKSAPAQSLAHLTRLDKKPNKKSKCDVDTAVIASHATSTVPRAAAVVGQATPSAIQPNHLTRQPPIFQPTKTQQSLFSVGGPGWDRYDDPVGMGADSRPIYCIKTS